MTRRAPLPARLGRDHRGVAALEFAILAPVLILMLMGMLDLSYQAYVKSLLEGAIQKAGRDSGIEAAAAATIDNRVSAAVKVVAKNAAFRFERINYSSFSEVRKAERFDDDDGDNVRDSDECFYDVNNNGQWDADAGRTGQGGAGDIALYRVTVTYPRLFPMARLLGWSAEESIMSETLLKNQPYATQVNSTVKICP